jgi:hypothetical protein
MIIGVIITGLALLINGYWVKYDGDKPLTSSDVFILMFFWPIFLGFLVYYFFIKKDLDV